MDASSGTAIVAVVTTAPDAAVGQALATRIVEERLAACANLVPGVTSIYRWQGRVERAGEVMIVFKTTSERFAELRDRIVGLHPYDVPEVLALPVPDGSEVYLDWVRGEVSPS